MKAALRRYAAGPMLAMHMPGHKRNRAMMLDDALPWALDLTEIEEFDDLHAPEGLLMRAMERAARAYGARRTFFLVNGSSGGLMAAIRCCTRRGDRVLVARNCHRSVFHALELCGLMPVYLTPPLDDAFRVCASLTPEQVRAALPDVPDAALCVITSPSYEGVLCDVRGIAQVLHERGVPLLVDEAHGAHLPFSDAFPESALVCGADIVVHSLHKTLPSLTQTALLHVMSDRIDIREMQRQLAVFQTSSPSYVLMASIDDCVERMEGEGAALLAAHARRLDHFSERIRPLRRLRVLGYGQDNARAHPGIFALDPSKLLISARGTALTGHALLCRLRDEHGIQLEMCMGDCALAMSTVCDPDGALDRLAGALLAIDATLEASDDHDFEAALPQLATVMPIDCALALPGTECPIGDAAGRVSAEYAWAYPPGVPLLVPGARINEQAVRCIGGLHRSGARLQSTSGGLPGRVFVLEADC